MDDWRKKICGSCVEVTVIVWDRNSGTITTMYGYYVIRKQNASMWRGNINQSLCNPPALFCDLN